MTEYIQLDKIRIDGGTQARSGLDNVTVTEYKEAMEEHLRQKNGLDQWPDIVLYYDGSDYWLADGFHRVAARKLLIGKAPGAINADVRQGTQRDAVLHAAGANNSHGLRRTAADKWRAVERLLVDPEWGTWSDREIARRCHVSPTFVGRVRSKLGSTDRPNHAPPPLPVHVDSDDAQQRTYTRAGQTAVMDTANIGYAQQRKQKRDGLTKAEYTEKLVPELVEFLGTYQDKHGRGWRQIQSVAAHTNSTPWQDITTEWKRRKIYYEDDILKDAIKLAFDVLNGEQTAVPTPEQIEGLVTRAANDVIDDGDLADYEALYRCWLDDGPDDLDWHFLEARTAGIPHGLIANALRSCYRRVASAVVDRISHEADEEWNGFVNGTDGDDYSYTDELQKQIEAAEAAVPQPKPMVDQVLEEVEYYEKEMKTAVSGTSILDSLKSTEWLIEEMMIQVKAPSPLFFALNTAVMAVRDAMEVASKLGETAVSQEAS